MAHRVIEGGGITTPAGFLAGSVYVGVKSHKSYKPDVAILFSDRPAVCAALFTTNRFCAAPIQLGRELLKNPYTRGVVINSGNANAGTGPQGLQCARQVAALAEELLGLESGQMFVSSTGVIGERYPVEKVLDAVRRIVPTLSPEGGAGAAWAIMTTDRHRKELACELTLSGGTVRIGAMSKGSGMIHPNMATTLTFLTTDAQIEKPVLQEMLRRCCDESMHLLTVDRDTSTNDSMFLFANGASGVSVTSEADLAAFEDALREICVWIARRIAADGEGATRMLAVEVKGLPCKADAKAVARAVASSMSVKTALGQGRLHWGSLLSAAGSAGADLGERGADCVVRSDAGELLLAKGSMKAAYEQEQLEALLQAEEISVVLDFHNGACGASAFGCDMTTEYVHINGDYRT